MVLLTEQIIRGKTRLDKLEEVKNLNLWGQDLDDVTILSKLPNVEVLSLSVNRISSLRDFRHCTKLQELYLRKNYVTDMSEIQYLGQLRDLKVLWLCDNPCADHPLYRQIVARVLPAVEKLDNMEVTPQDKDAARRNPDLARYLAPPPEEDPKALPPSVSPTASSPGTLGYKPITSPSRPPSQQPAAPMGYDNGSRAPSAANAGEGGAGRRRKNVLYAVMALVSELDEDDLIYVKREIEQRLGSLGR